MTDRALHIDKLKQYFSDRPQFTIDDIMAFYQQFEQEIRRSALYWRIHELKNRGILHKVGRGKYSLEEGAVYVPAIDRKLKHLHNKVRKNFPFLDICLWHTRWLNEFMVHQPGRFYILMEVEKDGMEPVFYFLQEQLKKDVYLNPSWAFLEKYAIDAQEPVLITHLVSESPVQEVGKIRTATLEKMLVDIFSNENIFAAHQGSEMKTIFRNAFDKYLVHEQKLLRYASRRGRDKRNEIETFIRTIKVKNI